MTTGKGTPSSGKQVLVILNPVSGMGNIALLQKAIQREFSRVGWQYEVHITSKGEDLHEPVRKHLEKGCNLVVVAGGDGTVGGAADALAGTNIPLALIPAGTWNALARSLEIPLQALPAIRLITGRHEVHAVDILKVGDHHYINNLGIGFSSGMVNSTAREAKRRFGVFAYFWNVIKEGFGLSLKPYQIVIDGELHRVHASEVLITNHSIIGIRPLENLLDICPDDGRVEVLVIQARTLLDLPALLWQVLVKRQRRTPKFRLYVAHRFVTVTSRQPRTVQADGEIIGETPIRIELVPRAVRLVAPLQRRSGYRAIPHIPRLEDHPEVG